MIWTDKDMRCIGNQDTVALAIALKTSLDLADKSGPVRHLRITSRGIPALITTSLVPRANSAGGNSPMILRLHIHSHLASC